MLRADVEVNVEEGGAETRWRDVLWSLRIVTAGPGGAWPPDPASIRHGRSAFDQSDFAGTRSLG